MQSYALFQWVQRLSARENTLINAGTWLCLPVYLFLRITNASHTQLAQIHVYVFLINRKASKCYHYILQRRLQVEQNATAFPSSSLLSTCRSGTLNKSIKYKYDVFYGRATTQELRLIKIGIKYLKAIHSSSRDMLYFKTICCLLNFIDMTHNPIKEG